MRLIGPEDMQAFRCLAGACRHTCCRGWEIDVDEESAARYRTAEGAIGERLRANLETDETGTHFRLDAQERCPFLNGEGLCDLILEMGEDALCQICRDHPRFRNFYSDHVEIGLGLVCEAAARQVVERECRRRKRGSRRRSPVCSPLPSIGKRRCPSASRPSGKTQKCQNCLLQKTILTS